MTIADPDDVAALEKLAAVLRGSTPAIPIATTPPAEGEIDTARWQRPSETRWERAI